MLEQKSKQGNERSASERERGSKGEGTIGMRTCPKEMWVLRMDRSIDGWVNG